MIVSSDNLLSIMLTVVFLKLSFALDPHKVLVEVGVLFKELATVESTYFVIHRNRTDDFGTYVHNTSVGLGDIYSYGAVGREIFS